MRLFIHAALVFFSFAGASTFAQVYSSGGPVVNNVGQAINATIAVCTTSPPGTNAPDCGTYVSTYTDSTLSVPCTISAPTVGPISGTGCTNPGTTDSRGNYYVYAVPGVYYAEIYGYGIVTYIQPIGIPNASQGGSGNFNTVITKVSPTYNVLAWGVVADAQMGTDGVTTGSTTLTCNSCTFILSDVGKEMQIQQGSGANLPLTTTIATFTDSHHVVLASSAAAATGQMVFWGTNNNSTAAAAIAAAVVNGGIVYFPVGNYMLTGLVVTNNHQSLNIVGDCGPRGHLVISTTNPPPPACTTFMDGAVSSPTIKLYGALNTSVLGINFLGFPNNNSNAGDFIDVSGISGGAEALGILIQNNSFFGKYDNIGGVTTTPASVDTLDVFDNFFGCGTHSAVFLDVFGAINLHFYRNFVDPRTATACAALQQYGIYVKGSNPRNVEGIVVRENEIQNMTSGTAQGIRVDYAFGVHIEDNDFETFPTLGKLLNSINVNNSSNVTIGYNRTYDSQNAVNLVNNLVTTVASQYVDGNGVGSINGINYTGNTTLDLWEPQQTVTGNAFVDGGGNGNERFFYKSANIEVKNGGAWINNGITVISNIGLIRANAIQDTSGGLVPAPSLGSGSVGAGLKFLSDAQAFTTIPNAALANSSTTVNGQTCTLGSTCTIILTGTSGSIGGGALLAGACASTTFTVTGSTTAMSVSASPVTYPGDGTYWFGYVSSANNVTVKVCAAVALTPAASTYNVRVIP